MTRLIDFAQGVMRDRRFALAMSATLALLACTLIPCQNAYASIADDINGWLCGILRDCCNWIFGAQVDVLKSIGYSGVLGADFEHMLGAAGGVSMYDICLLYTSASKALDEARSPDRDIELSEVRSK